MASNSKYCPVNVSSCQNLDKIKTTLSYCTLHHYSFVKIAVTIFREAKFKKLEDTRQAKVPGELDETF